MMVLKITPPPVAPSAPRSLVAQLSDAILDYGQAKFALGLWYPADGMDEYQRLSNVRDRTLDVALALLFELGRKAGA